MQIKQKSEQICVMQGGAVVLRARATYAAVEGGDCERFNECYEKTAKAYLAWAEHKQGKMLREEYAAQGSDRMFGFRPVLCSMDVRVVWQNDRFWSVVIDSVRDSGVRGEYPICHRNADVWDMQRGVIIPAKQFFVHIPALRSLRVGGKRPEGLWLDERGVVLYHNAGSDGYAEYHTGLQLDFVPAKGSGVQEYVPVLAEFTKST
ncbi:MAG: hypothetical protein E7594_01615 [Ruminococcaceae bacterium]|nr:hypothetical protein [Oscillospiraceae bacterium]